MKSLIFYMALVIVVLLSLCCTFYSLNKSNKEAAKRMERNFIEASSLQNQQFNLTIDELQKSMDSKLDSIIKKSKIKPKWIKQITNNVTYYKDTTITVISPDFEPKTASYPFVDKQGCFEFSGSIKILDTIPLLNVENRKFNSNFTEIEHLERDSIKFLGMKLPNFLPWSKKVLNYTIVDNCTGKRMVKKINIKRK